MTIGLTKTKPPTLQLSRRRKRSTLTPLRPVGKCQFGDRKIECVSESEMIDRGVTVRAIGIVNMSLAVRPLDSTDKATG